MTHSRKWLYEVDGERGGNLAFNLLIKSQVGPAVHSLATHNKPIIYTSLARTENRFQLLKRSPCLAMYSHNYRERLSWTSTPFKRRSVTAGVRVGKDELPGSPLAVRRAIACSCSFPTASE
jgi:hypothetical protein